MITRKDFLNGVALTAAGALMRDGKRWDTAAAAETGETYDLIVVGGGISGLSAAYFFRKVHGPDAKILVLDNHDDFGGHAKRNEFRDGHLLDARSLDASRSPIQTRVPPRTPTRRSIKHIERLTSF